ncbi:MAG: hypothetical protein COB85_01755 [Bacteroidetes bacterium]|nr:MAG: hypothetical protein COB85_01755 [Bacteroidota bacterium]
MKVNKTLVIVFILSMFCWRSQAQVSLDSSEFPIVGTNFLLSNVAFINTPPISASGPAQSYDFTGGFTYGSQLIDYLDASSGPFTSEYPTASLFRYYPTMGQIGYDQYTYYASDVSGFWQNGMVWVGYLLDTATIDTLFFHLNPPNEDTLLSNQYTYGYSDSTYALTELEIWFGPTLYKAENHLYKKIDADGWGDMLTGLGSYDSVLRVHVVEYKYDSTFINGTFNGANLDTIEYYLYYSEGIRHALVKEITEPIIDTTGPTYYYVTEILNIPPPPPVYYGCMDTTAINYNPLANTSDSSCVYCSAISYTITPDIYVCQGGSVTLSVTGGVSYLWSTGEMTASITVSPDTATVYSVYINESQFCWELATVEVSVYQDVIASFWTGSVTNADSTLFVNLSTDADSYYWEFGDSTTSTEKHPRHFYSTLGTKVVRLIASNVCSIDTFEIMINVMTGIFEYEGEEMNFVIFPNPGREETAISFELQALSLISLRLIDLLGRVRILEKDQGYNSGGHTIQLADVIEGGSSGIYFIELCVNGNCYQKKWIKQ